MNFSVSVIIPTYNRAHTLPRALDSVLAQTLAASEIIVIDDGSEDGTETLIKQHYPHITYLQQENKGVSAARNKGIRYASGDWIALLDSDDSWLEGKLAAQHERLIYSPECRLCHTEEIWIRHGIRVNAMDKHRKQGGMIYSQCLPLCVISPSAAIMHRSLFDDVGLFDEQLPACEDYDLWLRICAREPVAFVESAQINKYGGHDDQLSRQFWGMDRFRIQALQNILNSNALDEHQQHITRQMLIRKARIMRKGAEKRGKTDRANYYRNLEQRFSLATELSET